MIQTSSFRCMWSTLPCRALRPSLTWLCLLGGGSWSLLATRMSGLTSHCCRSELARLASASGRAYRGRDDVARRACVLMVARACAAGSRVPAVPLARPVGARGRVLAVAARVVFARLSGAPLPDAIHACPRLSCAIGSEAAAGC